MTIRKRVITALLLFAYCFLMGGQMILSAFSVKAAAAETVVGLDDTSVMSDLGEVTDAKFPYNPTGDCQIIYVTEYCYSDFHYYSQIYNVYIYVYNPSQKPIDTMSNANAVNIAVKFNENGGISDRSDLPIICVDYSANYRFYKFKLVDSSALLETQKEYAQNNGGKRCYDITGVEVKFRGDTNATDFAVATRYVFSGYAAGCAEDKDAVSSLICEDYGTNSIYLEVKNTNYRFAEQEDGKNRDELNSVYFSLPKEYFEKWGQLVEFTAEWYEYKTKPMFVTNYEEAYSALLEMIARYVDSKGLYFAGVGIGNKTSKFRVLWDYIGFEDIGSGDVHYGKYTYGNSFAPESGPLREEILWNTNEYLYQNVTNTIYWLFYAPEATDKDSWHISSSEVVSYLNRYTFEKGADNLILGKYAVELFEDSLGSKRLAYLTEMGNRERCEFDEDTGYVKMTFDNFTDSFDYVDVNKNQSAWNKFWFGTEYIDSSISPIATISEFDLVLSESAFSEKYKVNSHDVKAIMEYAKNCYSKDEVPMLCRFAMTNYYSSEAIFDKADDSSNFMYEPNGYVAQENVFLNFDMISLGFQNKNGEARTIIGLVSNPIDIINGLDAPESLVDNSDSWLLAILGVLVLIVIIMVLGPIISPILNVVFSVLWTCIKAVLTGLTKVLGFLIGILTLPFRLLWRLIFGRE